MNKKIKRKYNRDYELNPPWNKNRGKCDTPSIVKSAALISKSQQARLWAKHGLTFQNLAKAMARVFLKEINRHNKAQNYILYDPKTMDSTATATSLTPHDLIKYCSPEPIQLNPNFGFKTTKTGWIIPQK